MLCVHCCEQGEWINNPKPLLCFKCAVKILIVCKKGNSNLNKIITSRKSEEQCKELN